MYIKDLIKGFKEEKNGIYSICSSDSQVIIASLKQAKEDNTPLLLEATCNQVNQFGGYTGMKPLEYRDYVYSLADKVGFDKERIILGGDHLGTQPFKSLRSDEAMDRAKEMVKLFAEAGFTKIHLDASVRCSDDAKLSVEEFEYQACQRAAEMARIIEQTPNVDKISYIVGTEVPTPGGSLDDEEELKPTTADEAKKTLRLSKEAFEKRKLYDGWQRVCGLVVQPGVEFSDNNIHSYDRLAATKLCNLLENNPKIVYEAHSTDYQDVSKLSELVEDGFSILKVGPALTYAKRQAVFALSRIEKELIKDRNQSNIEQIIDDCMVNNPSNWEAHYHGTPEQIAQARKYSYSDRLRYYWPEKQIQDSIQRLINNLTKIEIPKTLIYEFMPLQYWDVREGVLSTNPNELINHQIRIELKRYSQACKLSN